MTHAATLSQLTDNVVRGIVTSTNDNVSFDKLRDGATKQLKTFGHARTNQFDIRSKLTGLVEKFAVLNREDLSEALQSRLEELPVESRWMPEILSFLLQLSDRPLEKTRLEDVEKSNDPANAAGSSLTWEELIADEPVNDDDLWADVERGYHSSADEAVMDEEHESDPTTSTQATSFAEEDVEALARSFVVPVDNSPLHEVELLHKQTFKGFCGKDSISELFLIRETLLMLHGLPTSLYTKDDDTGRVVPNHGLHLRMAAESTLNDTMTNFADLGSSLNTLRNWVRQGQYSAYLQSCQASLQQLLSSFGSQLASIEQLYLREAKDVVVSILHVRSTVERATKPLVRLSDILKATSQSMKASPFALLDGLYNVACTAELSGDVDTFRAVLVVFLSGLRSYLRSIARWIAHGSCDSEDPTSLVEDRDSNCEIGRIWQDRYAMKTSPDGLSYTPRFISPHASYIFALGKSQAFLRVLKGEHDCDEGDLHIESPDFADLEHAANSNGLLPFSELLEKTLDVWLMTIAKDSTPILKRALIEDHGLLHTYSSLTSTFCSANGRAFQNFAETIFWSLDHKWKRWKNEFLLSELANNTIGGAPESPLIVRVAKDSDTSSLALSSIRQLQSLTLETAFAWPVQNITRTRSPHTYSNTFTFLLQTYRAKSLLRNQFLDLRPTTLQPGTSPGAYTLALRLRQRLSITVETLHAHITSTTASLNDLLIGDTQNADDVDAMAAVWSKHDKQLETSLLLSEKLRPLRQAVVSYLELCEQFADLWRGIIGSAAPKGDAEEEDQGHREGPTVESLTGLQDEAGRQLSFIVAGLRGVSRAGGNAALETLAERLGWMGSLTK